MHWFPVTALACMALCLGPWTLGSDPVELPQLAELMQTRCLACHGPEKQEGGYRVDTFARLMQPADTGEKMVVPGNPDASELMRRLTSSDPDVRMPAQSDPLKPAEIQLVRDWIAAGAKLDESQKNRSLVAWIGSSQKRPTPQHYPAAIPVTAVALVSRSSDTPRQVWSSGYGEVLLWNFESEPARLEQRVAVAGTQISALRLSHAADFLAVASGTPGVRGFVEILSLADQSPNTVWTDVASDVPAAIAFSPDGGHLAVARHDGSLSMVDVQKAMRGHGSAVSVSTPHADAILAVAWNASGDRVMTASRDRTAKIFKAPAVELIANYDRHERSVGGVAYLDANPVSLDETGKLRLWSGDDNDRTLAERDNLPRFLQQLATDRDHVWLADQGRLRRFTTERKTVDDGKDDQGNPKQKNVVRWRELDPLDSRQSGWLLCIDATGHAVAGGNEHGEVFVWLGGHVAPTVRILARP